MTAPAVGPREAVALRALERARAEDAKDASLPPCKLCGGRAVRDGWQGGESTGGGFVVVRCERGDNEQRISLDQPAATWPVLRYWQWSAAEAEVMKRWRLLNG